MPIAALAAQEHRRRLSVRQLAAQVIIVVLCLWLVVVLCLRLVVALSVARCRALSVARCHALFVARCRALFVARRHPVCGLFLHIGGGGGWCWRHLCIGGGRLSSSHQREHIVPAGTHLCHLGHPDRLKTVPMELLVTQKTDQTYKS